MADFNEGERAVEGPAGDSILVGDIAMSLLAKDLGDETEIGPGVFGIGSGMVGLSVPGTGIVGCCGSGNGGGSPGVG